ncbi:hypothetical protein [Terribacillus saccharophilus]|uniref:hypothetical protein n=1 Tax=Terribacillus saccharophilus TaxID=361277 RepID=UPI003D2CCFC3
MAKIREIMAAKLKVQSENELGVQAAKDRKQREFEDLMGVNRPIYKKVSGKMKRVK